MRRMVAGQVAIFERHRLDGLGIWHRKSWSRDEARFEAEPIVQELVTHRPREHLRQGRWHGIAELPLRRREVAQHRVAIRHGLEATELTYRQPPALPVERADRGPWLGLDRPGGQRLGELQKEAPIAPPPPEQRKAAAALRMPEVVLPLGNRRQKVTPLASHLKLRMSVVLEIADSIPTGCVGLLAERK